MTAVEMFKRLGWWSVLNDDKYILYQNYDEIGILFDKTNKNYKFLLPRHYFNPSYQGEISINVVIHLAIHQQLIELDLVQ